MAAIFPKRFYTILGLNVEGKRNCSACISQSPKGTLLVERADGSVNRGVKDILIACVDGLKGFPEAIESIYPNTEIQHCIIHQIRNSLKYVASKNQKAFMADLKCVYKGCVPISSIMWSSA